MSEQESIMSGKNFDLKKFLDRYQNKRRTTNHFELIEKRNEIQKEWEDVWDNHRWSGHVSEDVKPLLKSMISNYELVTTVFSQYDNIVDDLRKELGNDVDIEKNILIPFLAEKRLTLSNDLQILGKIDSLSINKTRQNAALATIGTILSITTIPLCIWVLFMCETDQNKKERGSYFFFFTKAPKQKMQLALRTLDHCAEKHFANNKNNRQLYTDLVNGKTSTEEVQNRNHSLDVRLG